MKTILFAMMLISTQAYAGSMTLTTVYPSPNGTYKNLQSSTVNSDNVSTTNMTVKNTINVDGQSNLNGGLTVNSASMLNGQVTINGVTNLNFCDSAGNNCGALQIVYSKGKYYAVPLNNGGNCTSNGTCVAASECGSSNGFDNCGKPCITAPIGSCASKPGTCCNAGICVNQQVMCGGKGSRCGAGSDMCGTMGACACGAGLTCINFGVPVGGPFCE